MALADFFGAPEPEEVLASLPGEPAEAFYGS
jgi:hypothetical protein